MSSDNIIDIDDIDKDEQSNPSPFIIDGNSSDNEVCYISQQVSRRQHTTGEEQILTSISKCFKDWRDQWHQAFLAGGREFKFVYELMEGLMYYERQICDSKSPLSADRTNAIARAVARLIDYGNAVLNIDLIVRFDDDILSDVPPTKLTTMEFFEAHVKAHRLRRKLFYDYYKRDEPNSLSDNNMSNPDESTMNFTTGSINGFSSSTWPTSSSLQVPITNYPRSQSPSLNLSMVGSSSSINSLHDSHKSPSGCQIEMIPPTQMNSQLDVSHMSASIKSSSFSSNCDSKTRVRILSEVITQIENFLFSPPSAHKIANCFELLDSLLNSIERLPICSREEEVKLISTRLLKPLVRRVHVDDGEDEVEMQHAHWTACLLSIIRLMSASDFKTYVDHFSSPADLSAFLKDYLFIVKQLLSTTSLNDSSCSSTLPPDSSFSKSSSPTFPAYWIDMNLLASSTFLTSLTHLHETLRQRFISNTQLWFSHIDCLLSSVCQDVLGPNKVMLLERQATLANSIRKTAVNYLDASWSLLVISQRQLIFEDMIEPLLRACFILKGKQRATILTIFYDMMRCDYISQYVTPKGSICEPASNVIVNRNIYQADYGSSLDDLESLPPLSQTSSKTANSLAYMSYQGYSDDGTVLTKFTHLIIGKLNNLLIDKDLGDETFRDDFCDVLSGRSTSNNISYHTNPSKDSEPFKCMARHTNDLVYEFIQICLDLKEANKRFYKHLQLLCLFKLISFFRDKVDIPELYLTNLYKLSILHHEAARYVEAGYSLYEHAKVLPLSDQPIESHLRLVSRFYNVQSSIRTYANLKVFLYNMIIEYFDQGELWEAALPLCRELIDYYEFTTYEYDKLAQLHKRLHEFYTNIMDSGKRTNPEYFRVSFYGVGFPKCLRNVTMVYRSRPFEKLVDFQKAMLINYPDTKLLQTLARPDEYMINEPEARYLQINACSPVVDLKTKFGLNLIQISDSILNYYRHNQCDKFTFSRKTNRNSLKVRGKMGKKGDEEIQRMDGDNFGEMWRERTTLTTNTLPSMLAFFPVFLTRTNIVSPIESAIEDLERTNDRLSSAVNRFKADKRQKEDIRPLGQLLLGIVDAAVNGGISKYEKAFFDIALSSSSSATDDSRNSDHDTNCRHMLTQPSPSEGSQVDDGLVTVDRTEPPKQIRPKQVSNSGQLIDHNLDVYDSSCSSDGNELDADSDDANADAIEFEANVTPSEVQKDKLKHLIAKQVPLLDEAIRLHSDRVAEVMRPQQEHLEKAYEKLKRHIITNYASYLPPDYSARLTIRSHRSRNRSPIRILRSELGLVGSANRLIDNDRDRDGDKFLLKRLSDVGPKSRTNPLHPSSNTVHSPISLQGNFPYKQFVGNNDGNKLDDYSTNKLTTKLEEQPIIATQVGGRKRIDRRLSTPVNMSPNLQLSYPIPAPRTRFRDISNPHDSLYGTSEPLHSHEENSQTESIFIRVPSFPNGRRREISPRIVSSPEDSKNIDKKPIEASEANLVSL